MEKINYRNWLPELKSMTLFQDIGDNDLISLLEAMVPKVIHVKAGEKLPPFNPENFRVLLKQYPPQEQTQTPRRFKWDMPKPGEPGFIMGEIPCFSRFMEQLERKFRLPHGNEPCKNACDLLEMNAEMLVKYYNADVYPAQSIMMRNLLGILAQKVMDVRRDLFMTKCEVDIYNIQDGDDEKLRRSLK
ncbi:MAG: hypothetical protein GX949_02570 [Peptococcaceae bacterium]|jgi:hypothetical protein|nr:hypothetical protein [Peptococcaceae bacterium]